jgi:hypothetical protein
MDSYLRRLISRLDEHLSDDKVAGLICRELPWRESLIAKQHLARCWHCRIRRDDLEGQRADRMMSLYREAIEAEELPSGDRSRALFIQRLLAKTGKPIRYRRWYVRLPKIVLPEFSPVHLALAMCIVLCAVTVGLHYFWQQPSLPRITSNALLVRAERWDTTGLESSGGVVFQSVRITTPDQTVERSIYRDVQGKRRVRSVKLAAKEDQLRTELAEAGLDWDEPISASNYQGWHDHQHIREDSIVPAGSHLLKLTTTVPDGSVAEQSLTVRDTDFHPVKRTVAFRDRRTVEIAEVDFRILPWSAVDANVFEPVIPVKREAVLTPTEGLSLPRMPEMLTEDQLDEAELGARLILNQLHADTGEQIEISRSSQEVEVKGLVETDERKRELQAQLRVVPHLRISIESLTDLKNNPGDNDGAGGMVAMLSMPDQPSPLAKYLRSSGQSLDAINALARGLFDNALAISQESKAMNDLRTRFVPGEQKTVIASAIVVQLVHSHRERLLSALRRESELLAQVRGSSTGEDGATLPGLSLTESASRNLVLCKELTQTNSATTRSAEKILAEMSVVAAGLNRAADETNIMPQDDAALYGKK